VIESLTMVDGFVARLADHHSVSRRAVLRSMGIEPSTTRAARSSQKNIRRTPSSPLHQSVIADLYQDDARRRDDPSYR